MIGSKGAWIGLIGAALLLLGACGGSAHNRRRGRPVATRTSATVRVTGPAPALSGVGPVLPTGPVRALLRHVPPGVEQVMIVDLRAARAVLGLRGSTDPFAPGVGEEIAAARALRSLAGLLVGGSSFAKPIDFHHILAMLRFQGPAGHGLLLRSDAPRHAVVAAFLRRGWTRAGALLRSPGSGATAVQTFPGGLVVGFDPASVRVAAAQRAVARENLLLFGLLPAHPAPVLFADTPAGGCVSGLVAIEQLIPHAGSVSVLVRGRPDIRRLALRPGAPQLRRARLLVQTPSVSGAMINVPLVPLGAAGTVPAALRGPVYRCS